jgi:hypothetical protein
MPELRVTCPKCGSEFELAEAIMDQLADSIRAEVSDDLKAKESALQAREKTLTQQEREYAENMAGFEARISEVVKEKEAAALVHARQEVKNELKDRDEQILALKQQKEDAEAREMKLLQRERDVAQKEQSMELEVLRRVSDARKSMEEAIQKDASEKHQLELNERDEQIRSFKGQVAELERKLAQGSQQAQGEVLELHIENTLRQAFTSDSIEPVPKGMSGADVVQSVIDPTGNNCGRIVWEAKRTKNWSEAWIGKLRQDLNEAAADLGVIVSTTLPKGVVSFGLHSGIWVCEPTAAVALAATLRYAMIEITRAKGSVIAKNEKAEALHAYLTSAAFRRRIETIVVAFAALRDELDKEKQAMQRIWSKRNAQIEQVIANTAQMYGELQGIIGSGLSTIAQLDLAEQPRISDASLSSPVTDSETDELAF